MREITQGDTDRLTRAYFDSMLLEMRHIDGKKPDTSFTLYAEKFDTPIMATALSALENIREDAMTEMAKGAVKAGAVCWAEAGDNEDLQRITQTGAKVIKIIKPYKDNKRIFEEIEQAKACGALAAGIDIAYTFDGTGAPTEASGYVMAPKSVEEIREFAGASSLPFIIKGVLGEQDAYKALCAGAGGIVVSHRHGIMKYALPPLMALPAILKVVSGQAPVFVECKIADGMDAFKALALGAAAVCVENAIIEPLKRQGADGVYSAIKAMNDELKGAMAGTGCYDLSHMDKTVIHKM
ncbi:alpha-hydroxy-acid oxidizing enzyme [Lachnospiraceae bacterium]|nr:alpha-hydroxy-acid oxidizing enzyme [Lachnospiraceae bacterium]